MGPVVGTEFITSAVAELRFALRSNAEVQANAHLVAAAPDLLAACEAAIVLLNGLGGSDELGDFYAARVDEEVDRLDAAVRKARGET